MFAVKKRDDLENWKKPLPGYSGWKEFLYELFFFKGICRIPLRKIHIFLRELKTKFLLWNWFVDI